jgi:hypothetical protein
MTMEKGTLSPELAEILKKYNSEIGLNDVSVPFSAKDIRRNVARLILTDVCISARIVKAFAEVNFIGMPIMQVNYIHLIRYFIKYPTLLSVDQFSNFIFWLKRNAIVNW